MNDQARHYEAGLRKEALTQALVLARTQNTGGIDPAGVLTTANKFYEFLNGTLDDEDNG